jgi:hypothetical protein
MSDLKARILQAIRDFNGELDWRGLADKLGIEPSYSDGLLTGRDCSALKTTPIPPSPTCSSSV